MGMSSYILEIEENFWDQVVDIIKESEHISEAIDQAVSLGKWMVPTVDSLTIEEGVGELWNEFWSQYN